MLGILESANSQKEPMKLGSLLAYIGREAGLTDEEFAGFEQARELTPACPVRLE